MIRVILPYHLRTLAQVSGEVSLDIEGPITQRSILDALEARYPTLQGTIRDQTTGQRRPFIRFFVGEQDLSHESPDALLPESITSGAEPFFVVGAIAGGETPTMKFPHCLTEFHGRRFDAFVPLLEDRRAKA